MEFVENCSIRFRLIVLLSIGDIMKKRIFEWAILIWTSLLVLLIAGWIMIEFYDWKDTIVAAIIAFVGAIIGGSITLIGVKMSISEARRKDDLEKIEEKVFAGEYLIDELTKLYFIAEQKAFKMELINHELQEVQGTDNSILDLYNKFSIEINEIHEKVASSQLIKKLGYTIYKEIKEFFDTMMNMNYNTINESEFLTIYSDVNFVMVIEIYMSDISKLKTRLEKIHNDNLRRNKELIK